MEITVSNALMAGAGLAIGSTLSIWGISKLEGTSLTAALKSLNRGAKPKVVAKPAVVVASASAASVPPCQRPLTGEAKARAEKYLSSFPSWWFGED